MELWVVTKGVYEDRRTIAIATSERTAERLAAAKREADGPNPGWTNEICVDGPFVADELSCGCPEVQGLCCLHK